VNANRYAPDDAQRKANDQAVRLAVALIYQPLTRQQQREVHQLTARALGILAWSQKVERSRP
jgi:hypothetical protein